MPQNPPRSWRVLADIVVPYRGRILVLGALTFVGALVEAGFLILHVLVVDKQPGLDGAAAAVTGVEHAWWMQMADRHGRSSSSLTSRSAVAGGPR